MNLKEKAKTFSEEIYEHPVMEKARKKIELTGDEAFTWLKLQRGRVTPQTFGELCRRYAEKYWPSCRNKKS